jgi:ATP-dependent RNA helicase RhlE
MVLVASDIASRGIDVDKISHVVNYDLPNVPETYVHRIGRTGRAREEGIAFSFCDSSERAFLKDIEKHLGRAIPRREDHPFHGQAPEPAAKPQPSHHSRGSRGPRRPSRKY